MITVPEPPDQPIGYRHSPYLGGVGDPKGQIRRVKALEPQLRYACPFAASVVRVSSLFSVSRNALSCEVFTSVPARSHRRAGTRRDVFAAVLVGWFDRVFGILTTADSVKVFEDFAIADGMAGWRFDRDQGCACVASNRRESA
jgi:hypothetical protein